MLGVLGTRLIRNPRKMREGGDYPREAGSLRYRFVCPRSESLGEILPGGKHGHRRARTSPLDLPHDRSPVPIGQYQVDHRQIERTVHGDDPQGLSDRGGVGEYREIARLLWVVGESLPSDHGEDMEPHFARAQQALGRRLVRLGYRDDVPRVMAAADVFCLPSHFEGLPMSVIEAMLTGLPVVATDIGGPREQVAQGETGLLVPPASVAPLAEALARLAADPALHARMGEAGRARALERFDEAKVVARTVALLEG